MPKNNSPCILLGLIYLGIAGYNYWNHNLTQHNLLLLLTATVINFVYVANKTVGIILPGMLGYEFAKNGYAKDGLILFMLSVTSMLLDYYVIKKEKE